MSTATTPVPPGAPAIDAASARELDAAARLIEQLELEVDGRPDRARTRRALLESAAARPGDPAENWWQWVWEAGTSLGLRCRVIDGTAGELARLARDGARLLVRRTSQDDWLAVSGVGVSQVKLWSVADGAEPVALSVGALEHELSAKSDGAILRCVAIESQLAGTLGDHAAGHHLSPLARAWALLRPEGGDIWVIILFALVAGVLAMATPLAIEALVSTVTFGRFAQPIVVLALLLLTFLVFQAAIRGLQTFVVEIIQRRLFARLSADLAFRLPRSEYEVAASQSGRELVNRFFEVVTVQKVTAQLLLDGVSVVLNTLVGMLVLGFYHPFLLGFDIVLLLLIAFAIFVLGVGAVSTSIEESRCKYRMAAWLEDLAGCVVTFRSTAATQFALEQTDRLTYDYLSARRRHFRVLLRQILFSLGLQAVASTVLLGLGGWLVIQGQLTLGQLVAAELIVTIIVGSFAKLGKHMESYYDLMASVDKLGYLLDLPIERQAGRPMSEVAGPASVKFAEVDCADLAGNPVLSRFHCTIPAGARAVIQGETGSGKSVLLDLVYGLRTPTRGQVLVNEIDVQEVRPDSLRQIVSLTREAEVFHGTLAENVHLQRAHVSPHEVRESLEIVGLLPLVQSLPEGLETPLHSNGVPLSPNQVRKLMLARAIVGRPALLLIDGVLDALPDSEAAAVMDSLCRPDRPWTLLLVTGRADLAAMGTHRIDVNTGLQAAPHSPGKSQERTHGH